MDFSTIIDPFLACCTTSAATASKAVISVALPAPDPRILVGVLTAIMTISESRIHFETLVEKNKFGIRDDAVSPCCLSCNSCALCCSTMCECTSVLGDMVVMGSFWSPSRATRTISVSPGSYIGRCREFHLRMRRSSLSATVTRICGFLNAMMAAVGPPVGDQTVSHERQY